MSADLRALVALAAAAFAAWLFTPVAIAIASRLRFFDVPVGYKGHKRATPYLGGAAIVTALLVAVGSLGHSFQGEWTLLGFAALLCALGTLDDRINVPVGIRVAVEIGIGVAIWAMGDGWAITGYDGFNLVVTVLWIVGVVNAFNLMDNMDGAAATAAGVSAAGAGALALLFGNPELAPVCFAVTGACLGFLRYNLARPARIFMGDGGSLPIGLLVAGLTISAVRSSYAALGATGVIVGGLLVGLVIVDTSLVTFSRARGHRPLFSGGRDHLTHRIVGTLGSSRSVAAMLAVCQVVACAVAIGVARAGIGWVSAAGGMAILLATVLIWQLERLPLYDARTSPERLRAPSTRPPLFMSRRRRVDPQAERTAAERAVA
jgi:UDP-GlcNAc:undecaprenyl-phosphate/decaprenyl-phosphate GlcNAc-1-phosphate transferase